MATDRVARLVVEKVYDAFYKLDDPVNQIKAFVFDVACPEYSSPST